MVLGFIYFVASILGLVMIGAFIFLIISIVKGTKTDGDELINLMPRYSNGNVGGRIIKKSFGKRVMIEFELHLKNKDNRKKYRIFFEENKLFPIELTKDKKIWIGCPPNPEDIPNNLKETIFGKLAMGLINKESEQKDVEDLLRQRIINQNEMQGKTIGLDGILDDIVKFNKEYMNANLSRISQERPNPVEKPEEK